MRQWKLLVAFAMLLAFVAGAIIGIGRSRMHESPLDSPRGGGLPEMRLSQELGLSPDQREKYDQIMSRHHGPGGPGGPPHHGPPRHRQRRLPDLLGPRHHHGLPPDWRDHTSTAP